MAAQHRCSRQPKGRGVALCKVVKDPLVHDLGCIFVAENMTELAQYQNNCKACQQCSHQDGILPSRTRHAWGSLARCTCLWVLPFTLWSATFARYVAVAGWVGGCCGGSGWRINLQHTHAIIDAIHSGELQRAETVQTPIFQLQVCGYCLCTLRGVHDDVLG